MARVDKSFVAFIVSSVLIVVGISFMAGFYSYHKQNAAYQFVNTYWGGIKALLFPSDEQADAWKAHLQPSRGQGEGVVVNKRPDDGKTVLLVGFFDDENQARLVNRDGSVVARWSLDFFEHFPDEEKRACQIKSPMNTDIHGATLSSSGELVANYEYCGTVKLDHCGNLQWRLEEITHHSIARARAGGYWILGRDEWFTDVNRNRFPPFSLPAEVYKIQEDLILRVTEDGEVTERISIPQLMVDGGLESYMTATGEDFNLGGTGRQELVHSNQVAELPEELADQFPLFETGDLALSLREMNMVLVVDPRTRAVKWHQTGPWLRQHDPEFRADGRLSIFNNNVYRTAYNGSYTNLKVPRKSNIIAVDPVTGETEVIYGQKPRQEFLSVIRGQHELLDNDEMLIVEFDAGRVFQVDNRGRTVWSYVNKFDEEFVGEVTNAELFDPDYFSVDWSDCE